MSDERFHELENCLRDDAKRMLDLQDVPCPANLLAVHRQRVVRRRLASGAAIAVILLIGLTLPQTWQPPADEPVVHGERNKIEASLAAPEPMIENRSSPESTDLHSFAVPVVVVRRDADGTRVVMPGLYVPSRTEPVNFTRLTPVEQRAIRTVLGIKEPSDSRETI